MKNYIALFSIAAAIYLGAAYTRPHEPAGKWLHGTAIPAMQETLPECPRMPFSGLLQLNGYQHRPTGQPLQVVSPAAAGYTAEELAEIYPTH